MEADFRLEPEVFSSKRGRNFCGKDVAEDLGVILSS